jgi:hypothetical protein
VALEAREESACAQAQQNANAQARIAVLLILPSLIGTNVAEVKRPSLSSEWSHV